MGYINPDLIKYQFQRQDFVLNYADFETPSGKFDRAKAEKKARQIAKANNQRLLRLERANLTNAPAYQGAVKALSGVYDKSDIVKMGGINIKGQPRYTENIKKIQALSDEELKHMLYSLSMTQKAQTSTVPATRQVFSAGLNRVNALLARNNAEEVTLNDFLYIMKAEAYKAANKLYGYKAILQMTEQLDKKTDAEIMESMDPEEYDYHKMTVAQLKDELKDRGLGFKSRMKKQELIDILEAHDKADPQNRKNYLIGKRIAKAVAEKANLADVYEDLGIEPDEQAPDEWIEDN